MQGHSRWCALVVVTALSSYVLACAPAQQDGGDAGGGEEDAGPADPCATLDERLGTLALGEGYSVVESAPLSSDLIAVVAVPDGGGFTLYAADGATAQVVSLGAWPALDERAVLFDVAPAGTTGSVYVSWFLAYDGARFAAGYTSDFDAGAGVAPGKVALFDTTADADAALTHVDAPNNYTAAFAGDVLLVNGSAVGDVAGANGIYFLDGDGAGQLASFPSSSAFSGVTVPTLAGGVIVSAYYADGESDDTLQHAFALGADDVSGALAGTLLALAADDELGAWPLLYAARFGDGFAYAHGDFYFPFEGVRVIGLEGGATVDVLTASDTCTSVDLLADMGDDLLVGVSDAGGRRLLRVRAGG